MNISAINDTLLPVFLFAIYFVFVSVVRYNLKEEASTSTEKEVSKTLEEQPKSFTYRDAFSASFDPDPVPETTEEIVASVKPENMVPVVTQTTKKQEATIPEIIDSLGKRDIRKLCSPLEIKQKTNGTELTTEFMKAIVKRKFEENPVQVVEVMRDRFPDLLSTLSIGEQQQQLDPLAC